MNLLSADRDLMRRSYYAATSPREREYPALQGGRDCDVAVVGGGLAGLSAAIELALRGHEVTLLEAREIGSGASGRNGGQAIHGLACDVAVIEQQLGQADARRVWAMTIEALDLLRQRIDQFDIDCEWRDGYLGVATSERKARALHAGAERLASAYDFPMRLISRAELPQWIDSPRYCAAVHDPRSGHLHPLKYTRALARAASHLGVRIHESTPVQRLIEGARPQLTTPSGSVRARQVLLAGNVYLQGIAAQIESRIMPVGTYIVASSCLDAQRAQALIPCGAAVCDNNFVLDYFRFSADHRLLFGGRVSYSTVTPKHLAETMRRRMLDAFPQLSDATVEFAWGGFVDISMNRAPDFGRLPARGYAPNVYYLQGFSGHGLALTGLAGKLVAEAIHGDASRFDIFARLSHRRFPGGRWLRTPALVLGMGWYQLKDALT
jgi:gamma-glutamylputrescine oxidase